jgi:hypothetical protein
MMLCDEILDMYETLKGEEKMANPGSEQKEQETLISFESGHYKKVIGVWKGDSVWCHFKKKGGGMLHINKDKVEYMESFPIEE